MHQLNVSPIPCYSHNYHISYTLEPLSNPKLLPWGIVSILNKRFGLWHNRAPFHLSAAPMRRIPAVGLYIPKFVTIISNHTIHSASRHHNSVPVRYSRFCCYKIVTTDSTSSVRLLLQQVIV